MPPVEVRLQKPDSFDYDGVSFDSVPDAKAWILANVPEDRWGFITIFTDFGILQESQIDELLRS